jgi:hypothetical protein
MASDDRTTIRLELLQATILDGRSMVCLASWPRPAPKWGTKSAADIDAEDVARWNAPFVRDDFEFYVTIADYRPETVEYVVDYDRLLACVGGKWKLVDLGFAARSICRLGSDVFAIGAKNELAVLRKGKLATAGVDAESVQVEKNVAANVGSRIIGGAAGGIILELTAVGRKYRWTQIGKVEGDLFAVAGIHADKVFVGGTTGVYFHDAGRWRQVMRGFHGHVTCINTLPTGEVLAGTSTGELWMGGVDGMKQAASDATEKSVLTSAVRFRDTLFVAGRRIVRQGQRGFEAVELPGFVPRLSNSPTPTLHIVLDELWVVGPFGMWRSADGKVFTPLVWR